MEVIIMCWFALAVGVAVGVLVACIKVIADIIKNVIAAHRGTNNGRY